MVKCAMKAHEEKHKNNYAFTSDILSGVTLGGTKGSKLGGKLDTTESVMDESASRTQEVDLILNQQDERIRPGMFAQVRLVILEEKDAFVVPLSAIRSYNDQPAVFVVSPDDTARRVIVALGISNDNDVQVVSGLEQGDRVITAGAVTEGIKVHVAAARQDSLVPPDNGSEGEALRP